MKYSTASNYPVFYCAQCKEPSVFCGEEYSCSRCAKRYPIALGFPDFRVFANSYIEYEDDYKKAEFLGEQSDKLDFKGLAKLYYDITPRVSKECSERFLRRMFTLVEKGAENLKEIKEISEKRYRKRKCSNAVLEIGCRTGGFLVAAKDEHVIGIDIALRWLVLARKRLNELRNPFSCNPK